MSTRAPTPTSAPFSVGRRRGPGVLLAILAVVVALFVIFRHHENRYERMADAITQALARNDMTPVQKDFNAIDRPELQNRERVGKLSDLVVSLGAFKGSKEDTPAGSAAGYHQFIESFASGTLEEKYQLDADGKITKFHIGPHPSS